MFLFVTVASAVATSSLSAQLFTFEGRVNYSVGQFSDRFAIGDRVTGYVDFLTATRVVSPGLVIYDTTTAASIAGQHLFYAPGQLGSMENNNAGDPLSADGWGVNRPLPLGALTGFYAIQMTNFNDIMPAPANPPNDIPIESFYNAIGTYSLFLAESFGIDPVAEVWWDITSYHVLYAPYTHPPTPVPESSTMSLGATGALATIALVRALRRRVWRDRTST